MSTPLPTPSAPPGLLALAVLLNLKDPTRETFTLKREISHPHRKSNRYSSLRKRPLPSRTKVHPPPTPVSNIPALPNQKGKLPHPHSPLLLHLTMTRRKRRRIVLLIDPMCTPPLKVSQTLTTIGLKSRNPSFHIPHPFTTAFPLLPLILLLVITSQEKSLQLFLT